MEGFLDTPPSVPPRFHGVMSAELVARKKSWFVALPCNGLIMGVVEQQRASMAHRTKLRDTIPGTTAELYPEFVVNPGWLWRPSNGTLARGSQTLSVNARLARRKKISLLCFHPTPTVSWNKPPGIRRATHRLSGDTVSIISIQALYCDLEDNGRLNTRASNSPGPRGQETYPAKLFLKAGIIYL